MSLLVLIKRITDIVLAGIGMLLFFPFMLAIAIIIIIIMGRPVFFHQLRTGENGEIFTIYKFRTMKQPVNNDESDELRLTPFGDFLRKRSLDELPELWHVVKGDMSLVGPRPLLPEYLPLYTPEQNRRHEIKPGITGWAQINGRNDISWEEKFKLDVWYVDNRSFMLDVYILFKTVLKVIKGDGVNKPGHVTTERFRGS